MAENEWIWPKLIESLQRDIANLQENLEAMRRDAAEVREAHRKDIEELIRQLQHVRNSLEPIVTERERMEAAKQKAAWAWIERAGFVGLGFIALALWEFIKRKLGVGP